MNREKILVMQMRVDDWFVIIGDLRSASPTGFFIKGGDTADTAVNSSAPIGATSGSDDDCDGYFWEIRFWRIFCFVWGRLALLQKLVLPKGGVLLQMCQTREDKKCDKNLCG